METKTGHIQQARQGHTVATEVIVASSSSRRRHRCPPHGPRLLCPLVPGGNPLPVPRCTLLPPVTADPLPLTLPLPLVAIATLHHGTGSPSPCSCAAPAQGFLLERSHRLKAHGLVCPVPLRGPFPLLPGFSCVPRPPGTCKASLRRPFSSAPCLPWACEDRRC